jgi:hypothetical protein
LLALYAGAVLVDQAQHSRVQFLVPLLTLTMLLATRLLPRADAADVAPALQMRAA